MKAFLFALSVILLYLLLHKQPTQRVSPRRPRSHSALTPTVTIFSGFNVCQNRGIRRSMEFWTSNGAAATVHHPLTEEEQGLT